MRVQQKSLGFRSLGLGGFRSCLGRESFTVCTSFFRDIELQFSSDVRGPCRNSVKIRV